MRISDWSSDVCSSDLDAALARATAALRSAEAEEVEARRSLATRLGATTTPERLTGDATTPILPTIAADATLDVQLAKAERAITEAELGQERAEGRVDPRSEEHTSELQSLMRISYAVFCLTTKNKKSS